MSNFKYIKQAYNDFRISLLKEGRLPLRETAAGFWGTSICDELFTIFKKLHLEKYRNFLDIGSGDGRAVLIASLFTAATGIEVDFELYKKSLEIRERLSLNANFIQGNFFDHDFSKYDILFCYPDKPLYHGLGEKLRKELVGKFILYGHQLCKIDLHKIDEFRVNGTLVGVYSKQ